MPLGHTILRLDEVPSTNTLVLNTEEYLANPGLVVLARHQTGGRGRMGHRWVSLPGAQLQFSLVLHPDLPSSDLPIVALLSGLAVAEAVERLLGLHPSLKWPNDVLLGHRKVAGVLVESKPGAGGASRLVVGIGVNCQGTSADFPPDLRDQATTLSQESSRLVDQELLLRAILANLDRFLQRLAGAPCAKAELLVEWARRANLLGRRVRFQTPQGMREGIAQGITPEGYLVAEDIVGERHSLVSGEVGWGD